MPNGFVQRWQGKVLAKLLGVGSGGITLYTASGAPNVSPADLAPLAGGSSVSAASTASNIANGGVTTITPATAAVTYNLADPYPGREKTLQTIVGSSGVRKVTPASAGVTFDGINHIITFSTATMQAVTLIGRTTAQWAVKGVFPGSTVSGPAFSTA